MKQMSPGCLYSFYHTSLSAWQVKYVTCSPQFSEKRFLPDFVVSVTAFHVRAFRVTAFRVSAFRVTAEDCTRIYEMMISTRLQKDL